MNIFKRPMLYAAIVSIMASVMWLYSINPIAVFLISAAIFLFLIFKFRDYKYITVLLAVLLFALSLYSEIDKIKQLDSLNQKEICGEFLIISEPNAYEKNNQIILKSIDCDDIPKNTKILVPYADVNDFDIGDKIYAELKLKQINSKSRFYNYGNGIYVNAGINDYHNLNGNDKFYSFFAEIRNYVKNILVTKFDGDSSGLMLAITTGDKTYLSDDFLLNVKETGISHIIVVSGMHLSIIISSVFLFLDKFFYNKYIRAFLSITLVLLISGICGNTMSVARASAMFLIGSLAPIFNRDKDMLSSLLTSVVLILIITPFAVVNISFLLSVLATVAVVWLLPFYSMVFIKKFNIKSTGIKIVLEMILTSMLAMVLTFPTSISLFGYASIVAPLTNVLVTYFITFSLVLNCVGILLSVVPFISYLADILLCVSNICCKIVVFVVNLIAELSITIAIMPKMFVWFSIGLIFIIIAYMYYYQYKNDKKGSE